MITVKLTTSFPNWPLLRQTPGWTGEWAGCKFFVNDDSITHCDYWVVYEGLLSPQTVICPEKNIIFIAPEPPDIKHYHAGFLKQFSTVITCDRSIRHPDVRFSQQSLPWMVGVRQKVNGAEAVMDYDQFVSGENCEKTKLLSVITTRKTQTAGHRERLAFVEKLIDRYGDCVDVYGRGFKEIEDKWDAIAPYKYHLVLENSYLNDYFTEKLTDAYLGLSYPIYWGCPNLTEYFPEKSFSRTNLNDVDGIGKVMNSHIYEDTVGQLHKSKRLVLEKYNLFAFLANTINGINESYGKQKLSSREVTLIPENFSYFRKLKHSARKFVKRDW